MQHSKFPTSESYHTQNPTGGSHSSIEKRDSIESHRASQAAQQQRIQDLGSVPGLGRSPGGGHGNPVLLPGEPHGLKSLAGYSPKGHEESDMTEATGHTRSLRCITCKNKKTKYK